MDKRIIEKFAVSARQNLIEAVTLRLGQLGIDIDGVQDKLSRSTPDAEFYPNLPQPLMGNEINLRAKLVGRLRDAAKHEDWATAVTDLIEEVAYTWFNRIIAIRFMEVNDYLPSGTRVLSSVEGRTEPDIMFYANDLTEYLGNYSISEQALIDKAWAQQQPDEMDALYRMLFLKQVNALNTNLPKLFERTDDFMQLLFTPSYHTGIIKQLVTEVPEADFDVSSEGAQGQVEIIGWLYQYYNEEPKNAAFKKSKYLSSDIPAVTQLFTPDWIVKYLVQNSLGRYWIDHLRANGDSREEAQIAKSFDWEYYMPAAVQEDQVSVQIRRNATSLKDVQIDQITFFDPAMGSGHILVYAFELFMQLYESEGYNRRQAASSIVSNNLYGLDIDPRAFQLTYFSMLMKLRQNSRRALDGEASLHVYTVPKVNWTDEDISTLSGNRNEEAIVSVLKSLRDQYSISDQLGSLIHVSGIDDSVTTSSPQMSPGTGVLQLQIDTNHIEELSDELDDVVTINHLDYS